VSDKHSYTLDFEKPLQALEVQLNNLKRLSQDQKMDVSDEIEAIEKKFASTQKEIYAKLTAWQRVQLSRHPRRPYALDYVNSIFTGFTELHGDRSFGDDQALIGGIAYLEDKPVMIIAQQKGRETKEKIRRNFGMPQPEGYRKALRLMKMAVKFDMPIVAFIDTPGAYPGVKSEERHVSEAIAVNLREMAVMKVPVVAIVIGEGGSGGALGIGVADKILILENAYYSVISPEGCAAILWKDRAAAPQAAEALKITAPDLKKLGIVDEVIDEPLGGAHRNPERTILKVGIAIKKHLAALGELTKKELLEKRYEKYREMGEYDEVKG
jgi:acetyl-CoA carboxylase carboxyl transferase subunit alpha